MLIAPNPSLSTAPKSLHYEAEFFDYTYPHTDCHKTFTLNCSRLSHLWTRIPEWTYPHTGCNKTFTLNCSKISQTMKQNSLIHITTYRLRENLHSNLLQNHEQLWNRIPENTFPHTDCHIPTLTLKYCSEISPGLLWAVSLPVSWSCLHSKLHTQSSHLNISSHYLLASLEVSGDLPFGLR